MIAIEINNLYKTNRKQTILHDVSFTVRKGEIFGIFGSAESGKTDLLRILTGLTSFNKGEVKLFDYCIKNQFAYAITYIDGIVNLPSFYPFLTGYEILRQTMKQLRTYNEKSLQHLIQELSLQEFIHKKTNCYSLYEKQLLGIADALLSKPKIIVLDEPFYGLYSHEIEHITNILKKLSQVSGLTVVITSNLLEELTVLCNSVAMLMNGTISEILTSQTKLTYGTYFFEVDSPSSAVYLLESHFPLLQHLIVEHWNGISVPVKIEQIPKIINLLCRNNISVFSIAPLPPTTVIKYEQGGGSNHA